MDGTKTLYDLNPNPIYVQSITLFSNDNQELNIDKHFGKDIGICNLVPKFTITKLLKNIFRINNFTFCMFIITK